MRHARRINSLSRTASHRKAMLSNMAVSLLEHKRIYTTVAKAKALRKYVEPLITRSRVDTTHSRRVVFAYLRNKAIIDELYTVIAEKIADRPGGYTRILRIGIRKGDVAEMCMIELVDFNTWTTGSGSVEQEKSRRRRGRGKGKADKKQDKTEQQIPVVSTGTTAATTETVVPQDEQLESTPTAATAETVVPQDEQLESTPTAATAETVVSQDEQLESTPTAATAETVVSQDEQLESTPTAATAETVVPQDEQLESTPTVATAETVVPQDEQLESTPTVATAEGEELVVDDEPSQYSAEEEDSKPENEGTDPASEPDPEKI